MPQPMNPPRIIIRPAKNLEALSGLLFSFHSCCDDPTPGITRHHSANPFVDGHDIYCENCDTTLASMTWNPEDMRDYSNQENTRKADEAAAENDEELCRGCKEFDDSPHTHPRRNNNG